MPEKFTDYIARLCHICQLACPKCQKNVCLACNEPCEAKKEPVAIVDHTGTRAPDVLLHCANLQAIIVGVGLHMAGKLCGFNHLLHLYTIRFNYSDAVCYNVDLIRGRCLVYSVKRYLRDAQAKDLGRHAVWRRGRLCATRCQESILQGRDRLRWWSRSCDTSASITLASSGLTDATDAQDSGIKAAARVQQTKDKQLAELLSHVRVYLPNRDRPGPFQNSDQYGFYRLLPDYSNTFAEICSLFSQYACQSDFGPPQATFQPYRLNAAECGVSQRYERAKRALSV